MASEPRHQEIHFERTDISARKVLFTGISLLAALWVIIGVVYLCFVYLVHQRAAASPPPLSVEEHGNPLPPEPRLQSSPRQDLKAMRKQEDWDLNHYAWIDKGKGVVAIPIERAIAIVAQRGVPQRTPGSKLVLSQPAAGTRLTGFEGKVQPELR